MATSFLSSETGGFTTFLQRARWTLSGLHVSPQRQRMDFPVLYCKPHAFKAPGEPTNISLRKGRRVTGGYDFCYVLFLVLLCFGLEFQEKIAVSSYIFERAPPLVKGRVYFL